MTTSLTATFVFTDLVGSTAISQRLGPDAAEELRRAHFALLRGAVLAAGGVEVKNLGDGLMVMFTSPSRALACGVAMQQAVDRQNRRSNEPLGLRIGIAAGEVSEEDDDYFGDPVVEAARLCALAEGGQVLATDTVRVLAGRNAGQELRPIGDVELKGIPEPVAAVELVWEPDDRSGVGGVPMPLRLSRATTDSLFGFFGRTDALDVLHARRKESAVEGTVEVVLVSGEAGIGKSTVVAHACRTAHADGSVVLFGHCDEDLGVPYQPWIEALAHLLESDRAVIEELPSAQQAALGRLLPALDLPTDQAPGDADTERLLLMDAVVSLLRSVAEEAPVVLVLDDLHWADLATLQLIRRVVVGGSAMSLLVLGTYRDTDLSASDALTPLLADLRREPHVERLALDGLGDLDVADLMAAAAGHDLDDEGLALAHALRRETAGNPFFTAELLRHLGETGAIVQTDAGRWVLDGDLADLGLPSSVRDVVGRRVDRLGPDAMRVLTLAAVMGRTFEIDVLEAVAEVDDDELLDLVDGAVAAAVISETERPDRYRFVHALVQHTLYADLSPLRRQRAHQRVAETLERVSGPGERLPELARHWLAATRPADPEKALEYTERAGDAALAALAPEDAVRWYRSAVDLASHHPGDDARLARLLVGLGTAQFHAGKAEHRDTLLEAGQIADRLGETDLLAAAVLGSVGQVTMRDEDPEMLELTRRALDAVGPVEDARRARLLAAMAMCSSGSDHDTRGEYLREAIAAARASGDDETLALMVPASPMAQLPYDELVSLHREGVAAADRTGQPALRALARSISAQLAIERADIREARRCSAEVAALAQESGLDRSRMWAVQSRGMLELLVGDVTAAEATAEELLHLGLELGLAEALAQYGGQIFELRRHQGRLGEIAGFYEEAAAENPNIPVLTAAVATLQLAVHRDDEARALLDAMLADGSASAPRDGTRTTWIGHCAEAAARLGAVQHGATLRTLIATAEGEVISPGTVCMGAVSRYVGLLDHLAGDLDEAEANLRASVATHQQIEAPYWIALSQLDLADLLADRGSSGDAEEAAALRAAARSAAERFGYRGLAARVSSTA